jgi:mannose-6-phosphate isomerase-like protein (cupin superfamily)
MRLSGKVQKGWGYEIIWTSNDKYCGKKMVFEKAGAKFSMHFHREKDESWLIDCGSFLLRWIDTATAAINQQVLKEGDTWHNPPHLPHQLEALEDNSVVIEVSTPDSVEDNFRIFPGDSQR